MIKIIHGADFHLDSPFSGLTPQQAAQRRGEQRELLDRLGELARQREADVVLLAGDILDSGRVFQETGRALARVLGDIPCPVFISPGNHDPYTGRSLYATMEWPDNVHIFAHSEMEEVFLSEHNCAIYGRAFQSSREEESPLGGFSAPQDGRIHLGVLHGEVDGQGTYGPISQMDIAASGLDYLALGHIHQQSGLNQAGSTFWAYPGCPEGRGFDELGEKGVYYLEVEQGKVTSEFIPLCGRKYEILSVDVTGAEELLPCVLSALPADTQQDVYRILLTGERREDGFSLTALERELASRFYGLTLRDKTTIQRDVWSRMGEDTLGGLFLQDMARRCQEEPENEILQQAVRFGLAALEGGEDIAL